jgi:hypothetical protein
MKHPKTTWGVDSEEVLFEIMPCLTHSDENHFFHQILLRLSAKLPFGYFRIPQFSFFKILTLN